MLLFWNSADLYNCILFDGLFKTAVAAIALTPQLKPLSVAGGATDRFKFLNIRPLNA